MSEDGMIVSNAIVRIDTILNEKPLIEGIVNTIPSDYSITLENVCYSYDGNKNALDNISLQILLKQLH